MRDSPDPLMVIVTAIQGLSPPCELQLASTILRRRGRVPYCGRLYMRAPVGHQFHAPLLARERSSG